MSSTIESFQNSVDESIKQSNYIHHQGKHMSELSFAQRIESPIFNTHKDGSSHIVGGDPDHKKTRSIKALMAYENGNVNALMALANEAKTTPGLGQVLIDTFKGDMSSAEFNAVKREVLEGDTAGLSAVSRQYGHG